MGRRKAATPSVKFSITLRLSPDLHTDLIEMLNSTPNKSRLVAEGLYAKLYGSTGQQVHAEQDDTREHVQDLLSNWDF